MKWQILMIRNQIEIPIYIHKISNWRRSCNEYESTLSCFLFLRERGDVSPQLWWSVDRLPQFCKTIFLKNPWNSKFYLYLPILAAWRLAAPFSLCMWRKEQQSKRDAWTRWTIRRRWQQNWPKPRDVARPRLAMLLGLLPTQALSVNWAPTKAQQSAYQNLQSEFTVCFMN